MLGSKHTFTYSTMMKYFIIMWYFSIATFSVATFQYFTTPYNTFL